MRTLAIIQARMGSTRLPGKVLFDINGETMLACVVRRVRQSAMLDQVVVATTLETADNQIVAACDALDVDSYRGNEEDVLDRYYRAAQVYKADSIVRITSDCPLIDPTIIDKVIHIFLNESVDYASNTLTRSYPRGLDTEVFTLHALSQAWRDAKEPYQRSHVTPYIYQNPHLFRLAEIKHSSDLSRHRWTVDTDEDLELVRQIYFRLAAKLHFGWQDVLNLLEREPELQLINQDVEQKPLVKG